MEIEGSRVSVDGKPAIIAAVVKRGDQALRLGDPAGIPAWSGWRPQVTGSPARGGSQAVLDTDTISFALRGQGRLAAELQRRSSWF